MNIITAHSSTTTSRLVETQSDSIPGAGLGRNVRNRQVTTQIRLKDGETNMLAGLIRDDERRIREGIPGISDLPGVGHLFGHTRNEHNQTDVILMLTPHIIRVLDLTEEDLRAFLMGRSEGTGGGVGAGVPLAVPLPGQTMQPAIPDDFPPAAPPAAPQPAPPQPVLPLGPPPPPKLIVYSLLMLSSLPPLVARANLFDTRTAIVEGDKSFSYHDLRAAAGRASARLLEARADLSEARVAFLIPPGFDHVALQWGIWSAGGIAVPLPIGHPPAEIEYLVRDAEATTIVSASDIVDELAPIAKAAGARLVTPEEVFDVEAGPSAGLGFSPALRGQRSRWSGALMVYTSGTTGRPKGS